jgi:hypothetical protein
MKNVFIFEISEEKHRHLYINGNLWGLCSPMEIPACMKMTVFFSTKHPKVPDGNQSRGGARVHRRQNPETAQAKSGTLPSQHLTLPPTASFYTILFKTVIRMHIPSG